MKFADNKGVVYVLSALLILAVAGYFFIFSSNLSSALYVISLNDNPVVQRVSVAAVGEVTSIDDQGFTISVEGEDLVVRVHNETGFAPSASLQAILGSKLFERNDIVIGDWLNVSGTISGGEFWADNISLRT